MIYRCECGCGERLRLSEQQYAALAKAGAVWSPWCALREGRPKLAHRGEAVAVKTAPSVSNLMTRLKGGV